MGSFIEKCMQNLKEIKSEARALNVIRTLSEMLDRYEGKKPIIPDYKSAAMMFSNF